MPQPDHAGRHEMDACCRQTDGVASVSSTRAAVRHTTLQMMQKSQICIHWAHHKLVMWLVSVFQLTYRTTLDRAEGGEQKLDHN